MCCKQRKWVFLACFHLNVLIGRAVINSDLKKSVTVDLCVINVVYTFIIVHIYNTGALFLADFLSFRVFLPHVGCSKVQFFLSVCVHVSPSLPF